jgi:putative inorganic carbon (HCO3(-)) transporter
LAAVIGLCYVAALTSWSRGGLVALAAMSVFLVWHSRHKIVALTLLAMVAALAVGVMPEKWEARMETISSYQSDQSFQGHEEAWRKGLAYVERDPWTGSGFDGGRYLTAEIGRGGKLGQRAWHSAYVQILTDHGVPGFVLWTLLLGGTLVQLTSLIGHARRSGDLWLADCAAMLRATFTVNPANHLRRAGGPAPTRCGAAG